MRANRKHRELLWWMCTSGPVARNDNNNRSAHFNTFTHAKTNLYTNSHTKASEHIAPPIKT